MLAHLFVWLGKLYPARDDSFWPRTHILHGRPPCPRPQAMPSVNRWQPDSAGDRIHAQGGALRRHPAHRRSAAKHGLVGPSRVVRPGRLGGGQVKPSRADSLGVERARVQSWITSSGVVADRRRACGQDHPRLRSNDRRVKDGTRCGKAPRTGGLAQALIKGATGRVESGKTYGRTRARPSGRAAAQAQSSSATATSECGPLASGDEETYGSREPQRLRNLKPEHRGI
jgi:hypothetical protein